MKITAELLRSKTNGPLKSVEYLDLSNLNLVSLEKLHNCPKLKTLDLTGNSLYEVANLESCQQLWNIDLSNNELKSIDGLCQFVALGTLNLSNNDLTWRDMTKLRSIHILELNLHGNQQMEKEPYYRIHVIDCLPNIWMLDGRIITSAERQQVKHFFQDSALTDHPIRHKLSREWFVPSSLKKIGVHGIYGDKTTHLMTRFPSNGLHNIETDKRRLKYIAYSIQEDLMLEKKFTRRDIQVLKYRPTFLEDILDGQLQDRERCNMLLLILVASLEFKMPTHLIKETLDTAKLSKIGKVYTMDLFLLPREIRCSVVSVMLSAVKIDKDENVDGGLYNKLYLCLFFTVTELTRARHANQRSGVRKYRPSSAYHGYRCLLASEIVQLLCIVPAFFDYVDSDIGVMNLLITATGDINIAGQVSRLSASIKNSGGDLRKLYEDIAEFLIQKVQEQSLNLTNKSSQIFIGEDILGTTKAFPMKAYKTAVDAAEYHTKGVTSPDTDPPQVLSKRRIAERYRKRFPHLGDYLLLGPQTLGRIVSLPQPFIALVSMDAVPVANGAMVSKLRQSEDHYTYVNMEQLDWDQLLSCWKPRGAVGDKFTIHSVEEVCSEVEKQASSINVQRPNSPELSPPITGRESTAPLIYASTHAHQVTSLDAQKPKNSDMPRPMSSLLKEKLDLKLDWSRRVQSADSAERNPAIPVSSNPQRSGGNTPTGRTGEILNHSISHTSTNASSDCLHCALEAAQSQGDFSTEIEDQGPVPTLASEEVIESVSQQGFSPQNDKGDGESFGGSNVERELENLSPSAGPTGTKPPENVAELNTDQLDFIPRSNSQLQVQMPRVGGAESTEVAESVEKQQSSSTQDMPASIGKGSGVTPVNKGRQQGRPFSGKLMLSGKSLSPVVGEQPKKMNANITYFTTYQNERTEAWMRSTHNSPVPGSAHGVPILRASSASVGRLCSRVSVQKAGDWLGGGRDIFWEDWQKRPKSGHVPGWREGLDELKQRPKSAAASRTLRRSRTTTPITPSSLAYEAIIHGRSPHDFLPELPALSDYPTMHYQTGNLRRLGSPQSRSSDFNIPTQDAVYR